MEQLYQYFYEENFRLDKRLEQINSETLKACEKILENPERYTTKMLNYAEQTKNQILYM